MSAPFIETIGIVKRFGAQMALGGVSMDVRAGEVVALAGENGAGKSTLVAICSGGKPVEPRIDTGTELVTAANAASYRK